MSYLFNSSNENLDGTFSSGFNVPISIVCWIKVGAASWAETNKDWIVIFSDNFTDSNNSVVLSKTIGNPDEVIASTRDASSDSNAQEQHPDGTYDDTWVMIAGVFTSTVLRDVYVEDSANTGQATAEKILVNPLDSLRICGQMSGFNFMTGRIAEPAIFDVALTTAMIDDLQTGAQQGIRPNLVDPTNCIGYWRLKKNQASHPDESGNGGPTLTVNGATWSDQHPQIAGDAPEPLSAGGIIVNP